MYCDDKKYRISVIALKFRSVFFFCRKYCIRYLFKFKMWSKDKDSVFLLLLDDRFSLFCSPKHFWMLNYWRDSMCVLFFDNPVITTYGTILENKYKKTGIILFCFPLNFANFWWLERTLLSHYYRQTLYFGVLENDVITISHIKWCLHSIFCKYFNQSRINVSW